MENLILSLGAAIGVLGILNAILIVAVIYLFWNKRETGKKFVAVNTLLKKEMGNRQLTNSAVKEFRDDYNLTKLTINGNFEKHNERLEKLENIEVPEHLTFTQNQMIEQEVQNRLAKNRQFSDSILEDTRNSELNAYNSSLNRQ